jgi:hypothetical protein
MSALGHKRTLGRDRRMVLGMLSMSMIRGIERVQMATTTIIKSPLSPIALPINMIQCYPASKQASKFNNRCHGVGKQLFHLRGGCYSIDDVKSSSPGIYCVKLRSDSQRREYRIQCFHAAHKCH